MMTGSDQVAAALQERAATLQQRLLDKVEANLSGDVLQARSGALKASVAASLAADGNGVAVTIASTGLPYAAIQEHGGTTAPHDIVPVKARALAFAGGFAARVHHPGSATPARAPLGGALEALGDDIAGGLKDAVRAALGAA